MTAVAAEDASRMRLYPALAGLVLLVLSTACVAADDRPRAKETPGRYTGPVASAGAPATRAPGPTAEGRLPPRQSVATASPSRPSAFIQDSALQKRLEEALGQDAEHYGVYAKDLATGRGAAVNAGKVFKAASLFKLEVMYEVFRQRDLGLLEFDELLEVTPYYAGFDLGTRPVEVGQLLSIADALAYMMSVSDNVSAVLLQDRVGAGNVNQTMSALGLGDTGLFTEGLPATAQDIGTLLEAIARSRTVPEESREQMLELMSSETFDNGLAAGVAPGTRVVHKTGNLSDATNDAGIVFAPRGAYALVVLSDRDHDPRAIKLVSRLVYEYFAEAGR